MGSISWGTGDLHQGFWVTSILSLKGNETKESSPISRSNQFPRFRRVKVRYVSKCAGFLILPFYFTFRQKVQVQYLAFSVETYFVQMPSCWMEALGIQIDFLKLYNCDWNTNSKLDPVFYSCRLVNGFVCHDNVDKLMWAICLLTIGVLRNL